MIEKKKHKITNTTEIKKSNAQFTQILTSRKNKHWTLGIVEL